MGRDLLGRVHDDHARLSQGLDLWLCAALSRRNDRPGMPHLLSLRGGAARYERDHFLSDGRLDKFRGLLLRRPADLSNHYDRVGPVVLLEHLQQIHVARADNRIAANADAGRLPQVLLAQIVHNFIGEGSAP